MFRSKKPTGEKEDDPEFRLKEFLKILHEGNFDQTFTRNLKLLEDKDAIFTGNNLKIVISSIEEIDEENSSIEEMDEEVEELEKEKNQSLALNQLDFVFRYGSVLDLVRKDFSKSAREKFAEYCKRLIKENSVDFLKVLIGEISVSPPARKVIDRGFKNFDVNATRTQLGSFFIYDIKDTLEIHLYVFLLDALFINNLTFVLDDWFDKAAKQKDERPHITPTYYFRIMWPVIQEVSTRRDLQTLFSKMCSLIKAQTDLRDFWGFYDYARATERSVKFSLEFLTSSECLSLLALLGNETKQNVSQLARSFSKSFVHPDTAEASSLLIAGLETHRDNLIDEAKEKILQRVICEFSVFYVQRLLGFDKIPWSLVVRVTKCCKSHKKVLAGWISKELLYLTDSSPKWYIFDSVTVEEFNDVGDKNLFLCLLRICARQVCFSFRDSETPPKKQIDNVALLLDSYFNGLSLPDVKDSYMYATALLQPLFSMIDGLKDYEAAFTLRVNSHEQSLTIKLIGKTFGLLLVVFATESPICNTILVSLDAEKAILERLFLVITEQFFELCAKTSFFERSYIFAINELGNYERNSEAIFEPEGNNEQSFPKLYLSLTRGFEKALFQLVKGTKSRDKSTRLRGLVSIIEKQAKKPRMPVVSILFARSVLDYVFSLFQDCVLKPVPDLSPILSLIRNTSEINVRNLLWNEVYLSKIEQFSLNNRKAIAEKRLSMANLCYLLQEGGEQYLTQLETALPGTPKEDLDLLSVHGLFTVELEEQDALRRVADFLRMRNLLPNYASIDAFIKASESEENLLLCDLIARNDSLRAQFLNSNGEPLTTETLNALRAFCVNGCTIFATRFDDTCERFTLRGAQNLIVDDVTTETLRRLVMLVSATDARVDDFDSDFTVVVAEFQKYRRLQSELELVVQFFRKSYSKESHDNVEYLTRLQAAFSLLRIREKITHYESS